MRHTKVHPLRSKCRCDAQSCLTGLRRYRMPLSHVFVLRRFEDTRESNYGHPSFAPAEHPSHTAWMSRQDNSREQFCFSEVIYARFCEPSSQSSAASELECTVFLRGFLYVVLLQILYYHTRKFLFITEPALSLLEERKSVPFQS